MTVRLVNNVPPHYTGNSSDTKPAVSDGAQEGSTFTQTDDGRRWVFEGGQWVSVDAARAPDTSTRELARSILLLRQEIVALRLGMIEAGTCKEVPQRRVTRLVEE